MATAGVLKKVNPKELRLDILPLATRRAFLECIKLPLFERNKWYLAGGTALALQVGHRQSVDLDFFTPLKKIKELEIERELFNTGYWQTTYRENGTIYGKFMEAKMSLIAYPFFVPSKEKLYCGTISILLSSDIAAMKIIAISQRGRKRDFFDLYWYCQNREVLEAVVRRAVAQYPGQEHNLNHIIKSLTYFVDAENDPIPKIFFKASWKEVKKFFQKEVIILSKKLLGIG